MAIGKNVYTLDLPFDWHDYQIMQDIAYGARDKRGYKVKTQAQKERCSLMALWQIVEWLPEERSIGVDEGYYLSEWGYELLRAMARKYGK